MRGPPRGLSAARLMGAGASSSLDSTLLSPSPAPRAAFRAAGWLSHLPLEVHCSVLGLRSLREARLLEVAVGPFVSAEGLEGRLPVERPPVERPPGFSLRAQAGVARAARTGVPSRARQPLPAARAASCRRPALRPGPRRSQQRYRCLRRAAVAFLHAGRGSRPSRPPPAPHTASPAPRQMQAAAVLPEEILWLLADAEEFLAEDLRNENLSAVARDHRDHILRGFQQIKTRYYWDFQPQGGDQAENCFGQDSPDDDPSGAHGPSLTPDALFPSDYQDEGMEDVIRGAQELDNVIKQGYLEKKSKDHSFFGSEWQKRWCVVSRGLFYYYANEKSKQPKGTFPIKGYSVRMAPYLRKDSKRESCFELTSQDRRSYEFTATNPAEARDWVDQISFLLKDLSSLTIPYEEEEEEEEEEEMYDDIDGPDSQNSGSQRRPITLPVSMGLKQPSEEKEEDDIYEVLPDDEHDLEEEEGGAGPRGVDYASYYQGLWDCYGEQPDELSFQRGDLIRILSKEYNVHGWWVGELHSLVGLVPKEYLTAAFEVEER